MPSLPPSGRYISPSCTSSPSALKTRTAPKLASTGSLKNTATLPVASATVEPCPGLVRSTTACAPAAAGRRSSATSAQMTARRITRLP
jgi:hypothetical protein